MSDSSFNPELSETLIPELSERLGGIQDGEWERTGQPAAAPPEPIISFSHVGISFDGRSVLEDVSFSVDRGQTLCILGRSGVGKSVALRMLMGFLKPDEGSICVEGQEITTLSEEGLRAIRKRVTMVFQNGALFDSLSVRENVA
ncbi:MAG: ATP-binding cassette domain-containing protein, partial [Terracidiphilus sp.]